MFDGEHTEPPVATCGEGFLDLVGTADRFVAGGVVERGRDGTSLGPDWAPIPHPASASTTAVTKIVTGDR
jgi:hypothetical protein